MKDIGLISILTTVYNGYEFLDECAQSIFLQGTDIEWWIGINGHGADGGEAFVKACQIRATYGPSVHVVNLDTCRGRVESLNTLATYVKGDWVAILDCDDTWKPRKLCRQIEYILDTVEPIDCVGTFCSYIGDVSGIVPPLPYHHITEAQVMAINPIINSSALFRRKWAFWEDRFGLEDYDLWIRMIRRGATLHVIPEVLVHHRIHGNSFFNRGGKQDVEGLRTFYRVPPLRHTTTVVSCYYPIHSKYPPEMYMDWIVQFWPTLSCPLIFFTEPYLVSMFEDIFKGRPGPTKVIGIPIINLRAFQKLSHSVWRDTHALDPERATHTPELYALWYEKKEFVLRAIEWNPFYSEKFVWCDAGICRRPEWASIAARFPVEERIPRGAVLLLQIDPLRSDDFLPQADGICGDFSTRATVGGGIIASDRSGWISWSVAYDAMLLRYHLAGRFIGKDQNIMASVLIKHPELVVGIQRNAELGPIYSWFSSLFFLAGFGT